MENLVIVGWIACAIVNYGIMMASFQYEFPLIARDTYTFDKIVVFILSLAGPCGLIVGLIGSRMKYGFLYTKPVSMHNRVDEITLEVMEGKRHKADLRRMEEIIGCEFNVGPYSKYHTKRM